MNSSDLTGKWTAIKVISYNNGKETVSLPAAEGDGGYAGSKDNPAFLEFTKHGELVIGGGTLKSSGPNVFQYELKGDSLTLGKFGSIRVSKIGKDTLSTSTEIKIKYYDTTVSHGKWILTYYYVK